jgi:Bacterial regulatory proteins, tetR family
LQNTQAQRRLFAGVGLRTFRGVRFEQGNEHRLVQFGADEAELLLQPRAYDTESALRQATEAFWQAGYSGTSLDALSAATGMNRPSLYGAFGN